MLSARALSKNFLDRIIFNDVDFRIGNGRKVGLVGKNGCGKSTLLKLITGAEDISSGNISNVEEVIAYIPQEFDFPDMTVGQYLANSLEYEWEDYKIEELVQTLKFHSYNSSQHLSTLSEGQKMKVKLIEVLLSDPTMLLIDEPTNHLDIEGRLWFENYLKHLPQSVLMISHDRAFLNHTVDEIWEIDKSKIFRFVGNYDNYVSEKMKLVEGWNEEYTRFLKRQAQLDELLRLARKSNKPGRVKAAKTRVAREIESATVEKYENKKMKNISLNADLSQGKLVLKFENVSKSYGQKKIFENLSFEMRGKDKIWLFGPNGEGKSTLVKCIMGTELANGDIKIGDNLKIGYYAQLQSDLVSEENVFNHFMKETGLSMGESYGRLNKFLFDREAVRKNFSQLSPGERSRYKLAVFSSKDYDFLILDEPDNHIDIETKEVLENSLREFKGALLLISHDRYFVERIGIEKMLNLKNRELNWIL